jgi:hypothetical protein
LPASVFVKKGVACKKRLIIRLSGVKIDIIFLLRNFFLNFKKLTAAMFLNKILLMQCKCKFYFLLNKNIQSKQNIISLFLNAQNIKHI